MIGREYELWLIERFRTQYEDADPGSEEEDHVVLQEVSHLTSTTLHTTNRYTHMSTSHLMPSHHWRWSSAVLQDHWEDFWYSSWHNSKFLNLIHSTGTGTLHFARCLCYVYCTLTGAPIVAFTRLARVWVLTSAVPPLREALGTVDSHISRIGISTIYDQFSVRVFWKPEPFLSNFSFKASKCKQTTLQGQNFAWLEIGHHVCRIKRYGMWVM